jgi:hypothetical protein
MRKSYSHWIKLQRKYRSLQQRLADSVDARLLRKLDIIARRLTHLNRKWKLGIAASVLSAWLAWTPQGANAQGSVIPLNYNVSNLAPTDGFEIVGEGGEYTTRIVEIVGDLNADGVNELVIGAYYRNYGQPTTSNVYVVFGKSDGFASPPDLTSLSPEEGFSIALGNQINSIANAGDVNNDGIEDLIMGSMYGGGKKGHIYVVFGNESISDLDVADLDGTNGFTITGNSDTSGNFGLGDRIGNAVSGNGDVNNDGIDDLAFGGYTYLGFRGASFVVFGKSSWSATATAAEIGPSVAGFKIFGTINNSVLSGHSVEIAGDFDGDGIEDLLIGESSTFYGSPRRGAVFVVLGKETGLTGTVNIGTGSTYLLRPSAEHPQSKDDFSTMTDYISDFNGDGLNDVLISAPTENNGGDALAFVVFGGLDQTGTFNVDNLDGTNGFWIENSADHHIATWISTGDFNGDGLSDVAIRDANGKVSMIFGSAEAMEKVVDLSKLEPGVGATFFDSSTSLNSFSLKGDITGDGIDDLVMAGEDIFVVFGKSAPELPTAVNPIPGQTAREGSTFSFILPSGIFASQDLTLTLSVIGENDEPLPVWLSYDIAAKTLSGTPGNGDEGTVNLKVIATDTQGNSAFTTLSISVIDEKAFVSGSTLADLQDRIIEIDGTSGFFGVGKHVSGIGDINGDGFEDMLISATDLDYDGINGSGGAAVIFGNASPSSPLDFTAIDGTNGFLLPGFTTFQYAGNSINKAWDFNGDDRGDFIVSDGDDSYVIFGANTYPHPFDLTSLDGTNGFKVHHSYDDISNTLKPVGDFNGDGFDDLATGTGGYPYTTSLIFGNASTPATLDLDAPAPGSTITFESYNQLYSAAGIGDINGDGLDDLAITSYDAKAHIVFGSSTLPATVDLDNTVLDGTNGFIVQANYGYNSVPASAGDLNADGIDDLLINSVHGNGGEGMIVVFGSSSGFPAVLNESEINGDNGFWFVNPNFNYYSFGSVVTDDGDFNHDGFNDLMVADGSTLWVLFSRQGGFDEVLTTAEFNAVDGFMLNLEDYSANSVSAIDFNGDGLSDIALGMRYDRKVFLIKGDGPIAPEVANAIADININEDQYLSFIVPGNTFSDANPNDELSLSITYEGSGVLPGWINVDEVNLALSGSPLTDGDAGTFPFRVTATDEDGLKGFVDFNVVVTAVNDTPVLAVIGNQEATENSLLSFTATAQDEETSNLQYSLDALSIDKGMTIDVSTGAFSWTPSEDQGGTHDVTITASDGEAEDSETITITVNEVNVAPVLSAIGNQTVDEESELAFTASATDVDLPVNTLTFSLDATSTGKGMTIDGSTGAFTWTPGEAQDGSHEVTVSVSDGEFTDSETFTITVNEVNSAPVLAAIGNKSVNEGTELSFTATTTDSDIPSQTLTYSLDDLSVASGMQVGSSTGAFSWTPSAGQAGDYTVTLAVSDGVVAVSETFTITVGSNLENRAPVVAEPIADQSVTEGFTSLEIGLATVFVDEDGDQLTISAESANEGVATILVSGQTLTISEVGTGATTVTVTAGDGRGGSVSDSFDVEVLPASVAGVGGDANLLMAIYPNPTEGKLSVNLAGLLRGVLTAGIRDLSGQQLSETTVTGNSERLTAELDLTGLAPGVYLLNISLDGKPVATRRIIKK